MQTRLRHGLPLVLGGLTLSMLLFFRLISGVVFGYALTAGAAHADLAQDAKQVLRHRLALPVVTEFDKWQADQWTHAATECVVAAGLREDYSTLNKLPLYGSGAYSSASDLPKTCAALAQGPAAECSAMTTRQPPFAMPSAGLPSSYVFLSSDQMPAQGSVHVVGGYCQLVAGKSETRQFFAGKATLQWLATPAPRVLNTAAGPRTLRTGTLSFQVAGMPGRALPLTVVAP